MMPVIACALVTVLLLGFSVPAEPADQTGTAYFDSWRPYKPTPEDLLRSAAFAGDLDEVRLLLAKGAKINSKDHDGWTALTWAQAGNRPEAVRLLLTKGADPNVRDKAGYTALMHAAMFDAKDSIETLLENGADVEAKTSTGWTALLEACYYGNSEAAEALLSKGADPNRKTRAGFTPLSLAMAHRDADMARLLLAKGADMTSAAVSAAVVGYPVDSPWVFHVARPAPVAYRGRAGQAMAVSHSDPMEWIVFNSLFAGRSDGPDQARIQPNPGHPSVALSRPAHTDPTPARLLRQASALWADIRTNYPELARQLQSLIRR